MRVEAGAGGRTGFQRNGPAGRRLRGFPRVSDLLAASSSSGGASPPDYGHPQAEAPYKEGNRAATSGTQQRNEYLQERGNNLSYVTKLGAYGLAVAAAFAVALAVLMSVSTTAQAQAAPDHTIATGANSANDVAPGDTVRIEVGSAFATVSITGTADGVGGSFDANDGQSISCGDGATCDKDTDADEVAVDLTVDADSGEGHILLSVGGLGAAATTKVINVNKSTLVGSLTIKPVSKTIAADDDNTTVGDDGPNETDITVNVKNAASDPDGLNDQSVTLITTLGTISCDGTNYAQACSVTTANSSSTPGVDDGELGWATVTLVGGGVEGVATITATLGSLTHQAAVTMFGSAKNLSADPQQGSIEIGGDVYVVLTVTDGAGNPVAGQVIAPVTSKEVEGPEDGVLVATTKNTDATTTSEAGVGYSKDFIHATDSTKSIPACGDDNTGSLATPSEEVFTDNGTNDSGQCVVHVRAPEKADGDPKDATRGEHTLNFAIDSLKASATIEVAGKPASITTDAPDMVEPASVTTVTVSVWDDEDILVGITSVKVRKVGGDGLIEDAGDGGSEMTSNGQSKFTFIAPSTAGSSEILITAGTVNHRVTLNIGEAMPEEPDMPAMPEGDATLRVQGSLGVFSGGSVDDLGAAAEAACPGGATIYVEGDDGWGTPYVSDAAIPLVNSSFAARFPDGLGADTLVAVTRCEADAMESEG